ncbi:hypothetical protein VHEMI10593 [[Torrubiella] hemipterigena]|uniref:Trafficking protein particle complex II-specific subunit 65 IgD3 domain-containing protein n=1 Tax=[Torrubiella] hemipterigena TaxID=1531966 RepID=A0A0A1TDH7_9HYPO|nr:hypothetical protein VHEMI10593 [[Torrubiella] hemipterigena]
MAASVQPPEEPAEGATSFADQAALTYLVPADTNLTLDDAFRELVREKGSIESIETRDSLFFDESTDVLIVLEAPSMDQDALKTHLKRLIINLEAHVVNGQIQSRDAPSSELIYAGTVTDTADPYIISDSGDSSIEPDSTQKIYAVWKLPVHLIRPRMRLQRPSVIFSASAALKPVIAADTMHSTRSGYLTSGQPSSINLLESFGGDPLLQGIQPKLSALRVSRVAPVTRGQDVAARLRVLPQLQLPVHAIVHSRIRFTKPQTSPPTSTIIGQLEFDFTPDFDCEVILDEISLSTATGVVECLSDDVALKLPLSCVAHDHITLLYEIKQQKLDVAPKDNSGSLDIVVSASALVNPGVCTPRINMKWSAILDFSNPNNPTPRTPLDTGLHRSHRPAQLSLSSSQSVVTPLKSPSVTQPDALPGLEASAARAEAVIPDLGITMSFSAPTETIYTGDVFSWTVYILNRASEKSTRPPRKLALVPVPKRRRHEARPVRPPSTATRRQGEKEVADAAIDENVVHAMQKNALVEGADIISLSADTRIGPLGPGACHAVELQFLALRPGIAEMEAIRVVDIASQEHVEIQDLPVTIIEPAPA